MLKIEYGSGVFRKGTSKDDPSLNKRLRMIRAEPEQSEEIRFGWI
jgi:hypothetical protein